MSECVVRMEMPKSCKNCHFRFQMYCGFGKDISPEYILLENRPYWCPIICQLPEGHGRLVDKDLLMQDLDFLNTFDTPDDGKELSYEDILVTIDDFPTIVPAERSDT